MKVSEFKTIVPDAPALPAELPDDYPIEQYLVDLFKHASFIHLGQAEEERLFEFFINAKGEVRASFVVPVNVNLQL